MMTLWQDLPYAIRMLRKSPSFTISAVVTLALAIGANSVVFGALNALILRPLNVPHAQSLYVLGRTNGDAGLPAFVETWHQEMSGALFAPRMATLSLGILGVMGAMLSITGIFGMAAYSVSKRLKELGIRIALGAQRQDVLQAALGRAFKLLAFGSAAGLILGILASRVLASIVYQATPRDPLVLTGVVMMMALLGLVATWIPARRASSLEPMTLLRDE